MSATPGVLVLQSCFAALQGVVVLLCAPLMGAWGQHVEDYLSGRRPVPLAARWQQMRADWHRGGCVTAGPRLALGLAIVATAMIPLATVETPFVILADPLAIGLMLLTVQGTLWLRDAPARWRHERQAVRRSRSIMRRALFVVPVLVLASAMIVIGLPGANGLAGLAVNLHSQPVRALTGGLVFTALGLLALVSPLMTTRDGAPRPAGRDRAVSALAQDVAACGWAMLVGDLLVPGWLATWPTEGWAHFSMAWLTVPVRLALVAMLAALFRTRREDQVERSALALVAVGLVIVLAGRLEG